MNTFLLFYPLNYYSGAILRLESDSDAKEVTLRENLSRAYETIRAYEILLQGGGGGFGDNIHEGKNILPVFFLLPYSSIINSKSSTNNITTKSNCLE